MANKKEVEIVDTEEVEEIIEEVKEVSKKNNKMVTVVLPEDPINPKIEYREVYVNGIRIDYPVGEEVEMPEEHKRILQNAGFLATKKK